jgi:dynein heavy chain
MVVIQLN